MELAILFISPVDWLTPMRQFHGKGLTAITP
jgi:hypothetical protein